MKIDKKCTHMTVTTNISIFITGTLVLYLIPFSIWIPELDQIMY